jgi:tetratricopeptide (TPR) repeat protein
MKRYSDAIADLSAYLKNHPKDSDALFYRGLAYFDDSNYSAALADLDVYVSQVPNDADGYYNRGRVKAKLGDIKGAIADLQQSSKLYRANDDASDANDADDLIRTLTGTGQTTTSALFESAT